MLVTEASVGKRTDGSVSSLHKCLRTGQKKDKD